MSLPDLLVAQLRIRAPEEVNACSIAEAKKEALSLDSAKLLALRHSTNASPILMSFLSSTAQEVWANVI
jgi:hypothetical protein